MRKIVVVSAAARLLYTVIVGVVKKDSRVGQELCGAKVGVTDLLPCRNTVVVDKAVRLLYRVTVCAGRKESNVGHELCGARTGAVDPLASR